jgi:hypothetical protein
MSAVLRLPYYNGTPINIYLIYDFKQIKDVILMVMYVDKLNTWKKIFVNYEDGVWRTRMLTHYIDTKMYKQVCNKLQLICPGDTASNEEALNLEQTMQQEAAFMLNVCS